MMASKASSGAAVAVPAVVPFLVDALMGAAELSNAEDVLSGNDGALP